MSFALIEWLSGGAGGHSFLYSSKAFCFCSLVSFCHSLVVIRPPPFFVASFSLTVIILYTKFRVLSIDKLH